MAEVIKAPHRVYKYSSELSARISFELPVGAEFLHVAEDPSEHRALALWFKVDPRERNTGRRHFHITGTGHLIPHEAITFRGTVIMGAMVWHVWEEAY